MSSSERSAPLRIEITPRTLFLALLLVGSVWLLTRLWPILLVIIGALILVGTIGPIVTRLEHHGMRRRWAVALVYLTILSALVAIVVLIAPPFSRQLLKFVEQAPNLQAQLASALEGRPSTTALAAEIRQFRVETLLSGDLAEAVSLSRGLFVVGGYTVTAVVLSLYLVSDRDRTRASLYAIVPRSFHVRLARIMLNLETIVGGYVRGQLITSIAITLFVFVLLTLCRVPGALVLAVFAGLTDVIPFIGGLLATAPAAMAAAGKSAGLGLLVLAIMVIYQEVESRILVPRIYGRTLRLSSATVVVALLIGGKLLGIVGALLALPIAAAIRMVVEELRVSLPGEHAKDPALHARDAQAERVYAELSVGAPASRAAEIAVEIAEKIHGEPIPEK